MPPNQSTSKRSPEAALVGFYRENGYMRVPNLERREKESATYRKGYEIRFVVATKRQLAEIRRLLRRVGFKPGKPFQKHSRWVQPVYGRHVMQQFRSWMKQHGVDPDGD